MENKFLENVKIEKKDLHERIIKLATFLDSDSVELNNLSDNYKSILKQQLGYMYSYLNILIMRTDDDVLKLTIG